MPPLSPLVLALFAIILLVALITWRKWNAFIALFLAALVVGIGSSMPALEVLTVFQGGVGATLGGIAAIIALGVMIGKLLVESGGAHVLAERFDRMLGPGRSIWCIVILSIAIGLVTWFAVGFYLLLPVMLSMDRDARQPMLLLAIPMLSFLSVMHGLMPPHPGPVVAIDALGADTGAVILLGFLVGLPVAFIAGPILAPWLNRWSPVATPLHEPSDENGVPRPQFGTTLFVIVLPVALMLMASAAQMFPDAATQPRRVLTFIGHPVMALTIAFLVAAWVFSQQCRFNRSQILDFTEKSVAGIGMTLLVVGGGGGFAKVLVAAGVADELGTVAGQFGLTPLLFAWLVAAFIRVATGSATVAITTAAGLLAPMLVSDPEVNRGLLVLSLGFGSLFLSHFNDGGFWIVKDGLGMTVSQTLKTWTVMETVIGIVGLMLVLLLGILF
jgi:GntP family gluconate:H+ symporter